MDYGVEEAVSNQLKWYNAKDLDRFCECFHENVEVFNYRSELLYQGKFELKKRYAALFLDYPQNKAEILHRAVIKNIVIDQEKVTRSPDSAPFEVRNVFQRVLSLIRFSKGLCNLQSSRWKDLFR